jgi:hypothetical protein
MTHLCMSDSISENITKTGMSKELLPLHACTSVQQRFVFPFETCRNMTSYSTGFCGVRPTLISVSLMTFYLGGEPHLMLSAHYLPFLPPVAKVALPLSVTVKRLLRIRLVSFLHSTLAVSPVLDT